MRPGFACRVRRRRIIPQTRVLGKRWRGSRRCARIGGVISPPRHERQDLPRQQRSHARQLHPRAPHLRLLHYLGVDCYHTAVKTQAYTGIGEHKHPVVENLGVLLDHLRDAEHVLVVDDIFDSGDTVAAVKETLKPFVKDLRFATLYYKPARSRWPFKPEFYLRETDSWLVFPHELMGLTPEEVREKDPEVARLLGL